MWWSVWAAQAARTSSGRTLPSALGTVTTLWPVASTAPVSWVLMWPVSAAIAAS